MLSPTIGSINSHKALQISLSHTQKQVRMSSQTSKSTQNLPQIESKNASFYKKKQKTKHLVFKEESKY